MIIIAGDSRIRKIEESIGVHDQNLMKPVFLIRYGAKLDSILQLLKDYKAKSTDVPRMVVVVGFICDALKKIKKEEVKWPLITFRQEEMIEGVFPSVDGVPQKREEMEKEIHEMWPNVRIIWVLPFPVDLATYIKRGLEVKVPLQVELEANQETLRMNNYLADLDTVIQRVRKDDIIPWFPLWKKEAAPKPLHAPDGFSEFMKRLRRWEKVPPLYPETTTDGLHPNTRVALSLVRAIVKKFKDTPFKPVQSNKVPECQIVDDAPVSQVDNTDEVLACSEISSEKNDAAVDAGLCQVLGGTSAASLIKDLEISQTKEAKSLLPDPATTIVSVRLPCGHGDWVLLKVEKKVQCNYCHVIFSEDELDFSISWIKRVEFWLKKKPQ